jgi:FtsP/CotA-like multicopper oxidase with cupredoxin domain
MQTSSLRLSRREVLRIGAMAGGAGLVGARRAFACVDQTPIDIALAETGCGTIEVFPTSPFILNPFTQPLPIPQAYLPGYRLPDGTRVPGTETVTSSLNVAGSWQVRIKNGVNQSIQSIPGPGAGDQDALGARPRVSVDTLGVAGRPGTTYQLPDAGTHQLWTDGSGVSGSQVAGVINPYTGKPWFPMPDPLLYHIRLQVAKARFTNSPVVNIDPSGNFRPLPPGASAGGAGQVIWKGQQVPAYLLPDSTVYAFNGTFPGPMINLMYGQPALVRFENDLDSNPDCLDRQDFGAPDWAFLTHQHNGHTAPESDGQPHHMTDHEGGYQPGEWVDNLYMGYPAGGDPSEIQSFLWFHDHRMHHTGANVYKGMVGLTPWYNPWDDYGDETDTSNTRNLHLPGRRSFDPADATGSTFNVKYDIPLAFYDVALDDGVTQHEDFHNGCGELHPEWWGKQYFRHFPDHGFVGDIFTVNGVAYPVLHVYQRNYRFRFLDCSVSRIYRFWLMKSTNGPVAAPGKQGQWMLPDGQQCMQWEQIASEGGLLPTHITRNSFELWPAKRREFFVEFDRYVDSHKTQPGDVIWLVNSLPMPTGRLPDGGFPGDPNKFDKNYLVPMMKIVIDGPPPASEGKDMSACFKKLRPMPTMLGTPSTLPNRTFTLQRGSPANGTLTGSQETQWLINSLQFDPLNPLAMPKRGKPEVWTVANGGGGWVHPMHMHYEEHHVLFRNGVPAPDSLHPDDTGREDVVALYPSEAVTFYRNFRTFTGKYVAHCHNLAHEDHNMMFGWTVIP